MPLIEAHQRQPASAGVASNGAIGAAAFAAKKQHDRIQQDPISRSSTPSRQPSRPLQRRDSIVSEPDVRKNPNEQETEEEKKIRVLNLKMSVPSDIVAPPFKLSKIQNVEQLESRFTNSRSVMNTANATPGHIIQPTPLSAFDDTMSLHLEDDSIDDQQERTAILRGPPLTSHSVGEWPVRGRDQETRRTLPMKTYDQRNIGSFGRDTWATIAAERERQKIPRTAPEPPVNERRRQDLRSTVAEQDVRDNMDDVLEAAQDTPSRVKAASALPARSIQTNKHVAFEQGSPAFDSRHMSRDDRNNSPDSVATNTMTVSMQNTKRPITSVRTRDVVNSTTRPTHHTQLTPSTATSRFLSSKLNQVPPNSTSGQNTGIFHESDYPSTSEEDEQLDPGVRDLPSQNIPGQSLTVKRPHEDDLDYDRSTLKTTTFTQLTSQPFTTDPRDPPSSIFDTQSLSDLLSSLPKLSPSDQKALFRSQTDDQWSETGTWFIGKFQDDMKRLVDARIERRKVSLRYENEIRKRGREVEWGAERVDGLLDELRNGGGKLIEGRKAGGVIGTPRKGV